MSEDPRSETPDAIPVTDFDAAIERRDPSAIAAAFGEIAVTILAARRGEFVLADPRGEIYEWTVWFAVHPGFNRRPKVFVWRRIFYEAPPEFGRAIFSVTPGGCHIESLE